MSGRRSARALAFGCLVCSLLSPASTVLLVVMLGGSWDNNMLVAALVVVPVALAISAVALGRASGAAARGAGAGRWSSLAARVVAWVVLVESAVAGLWFIGYSKEGGR